MQLFDAASAADVDAEDSSVDILKLTFGWDFEVGFLSRFWSWIWITLDRVSAKGATLVPKNSEFQSGHKAIKKVLHT